jgi:hypothetical protein
MHDSGRCSSGPGPGPVVLLCRVVEPGYLPNPLIGACTCHRHFSFCYQQTQHCLQLDADQHVNPLLQWLQPDGGSILKWPVREALSRFYGITYVQECIPGTQGLCQKICDWKRTRSPALQQPLTL